MKGYPVESLMIMKKVMFSRTVDSLVLKSCSILFEIGKMNRLITEINSEIMLVKVNCLKERTCLKKTVWCILVCDKFNSRIWRGVIVCCMEIFKQVLGLCPELYDIHNDINNIYRNLMERGGRRSSNVAVFVQFILYCNNNVPKYWPCAPFLL